MRLSAPGIRSTIAYKTEIFHSTHPQFRLPRSTSHFVKLPEKPVNNTRNSSPAVPTYASCLVQGGARVDDILIAQGEADEFLHEGQLLPDNFQVACDGAGQSLVLRIRPGYDHSYHFIASFIEDHFDYHARYLK